MGQKALAVAKRRYSTVIPKGGESVHPIPESSSFPRSLGLRDLYNFPVRFSAPLLHLLLKLLLCCKSGFPKLDMLWKQAVRNMYFRWRTLLLTGQPQRYTLKAQSFITGRSWVWMHFRIFFTFSGDNQNYICFFQGFSLHSSMVSFHYWSFSSLILK